MIRQRMFLLFFCCGILVYSCYYPKSFVQHQNQLKCENLDGTWYALKQDNFTLDSCYEIKFESSDTTTFLLEQYNRFVQQIGVSNEWICSFDPISYQPVLLKNSCPIILLQDKQIINHWYALSESYLVKMEVSFQDKILTLTEIENHFNKNEILKKKRYKRMSKKNND